MQGLNSGELCLQISDLDGKRQRLCAELVASYHCDFGKIFREGERAGFEFLCPLIPHSSGDMRRPELQLYVKSKLFNKLTRKTEIQVQEYTIRYFHTPGTIPNLAQIEFLHYRKTDVRPFKYDALNKECMTPAQKLFLHWIEDTDGKLTSFWRGDRRFTCIEDVIDSLKCTSAETLKREAEAES